MNTSPILTTLDLAYSVLVEMDCPLSAEDIAWVAGEAGYEVSPEEIRLELDGYIELCGPEATIVQIGRRQYGLLEHLAPEVAPPRAGFSYTSLLAGVGLAVVVLVLLGALLRFLPLQAAEAPAPQAEQPQVEVLPEAGAPQPFVPTDLAWWQANAANQLNDETQRIAARFLSNPYNTCGPAVLAVMANYLRDRAGLQGERVTAGEIIKAARNKLGFFIPPYNSGLLDYKGLRSIGGLFGLVQTYPQGSRSLITLDDLLARVRAGEPAILGMRYHYQGPERLYLPAGGSGVYNHFVILIEAAEQDGQTLLRVFNPHPGYYLYDDASAAPVLMSLEEFTASWALNDGSEFSEMGHAAFFGLAE